MITFAKGITSGYLPLGGVIVAPRVSSQFYAGDDAPIFHQGLTYSGHATVAAVGLKNLEIIERENLLGRVRELEPLFGREPGEGESADRGASNRDRRFWAQLTQQEREIPWLERGEAIRRGGESFSQREVQAAQIVHQGIGQKQTEEVIPQLVGDLAGPESQKAEFRGLAASLNFSQHGVDAVGGSTRH